MTEEMQELTAATKVSSCSDQLSELVVALNGWAVSPDVRPSKLITLLHLVKRYNIYVKYNVVIVY